jgi:hypothetical protein
MTPKDIARVTDYSEQTVLRVTSTRLWKQTGLNGNLQTGAVEYRNGKEPDLQLAFELFSYYSKLL